MRETIEIYCDGGSRNNGSPDAIGAWGYTMSYKGKTKEDAKAFIGITNNQGELMAVINALSALKTTHIPINVYVDSAYVLNGITSWIYSWKVKGWKNSKKQPVENKELWMELDELRNKQSEINFIKVKGHSDNVGNNRADALCNKVMTELEDALWLEKKGWA